MTGAFVGAQRSMVTLAEKEKGEEARYFASKDAAATNEMKAAMEKILEQDDDSEQKQELIEVLAKKDTTSAVGLSDWKFALPFGLILAIPAIGHETIVLNEETQLVACFVLFCSTMYTQVGGMAASALDETREEYKKQMETVDDNMLVGLKTSIADNEKLLDLEKDVTAMHTLIDDMTAAQVDVLNYSEAHNLRASIVTKLDSLVAIETAATGAIRTRMLTAVKDEVLTTFESDKKIKDAALDQAIKVLAGGEGTKMGKDVVGGVFASALSNYKTAYGKVKAGEDPILVQLEKDIAAAIAPPTITATGGNVYETHPIKV